MNQNELNALLISLIEREGVDYRPNIFDNQNAWTCPPLGIGAYNPESSTPFDHAHELQHIINRDDVHRGACDTVKPYESRANVGAILMLWGLWLDYGGDTEHFDQFCAVTGCPFQQAYLIVKHHADSWAM